MTSIRARDARSVTATFAAVGDVHGAMHAMVELLDAWERENQRHIDFVLQVGDFEPHRDERDLETASIPKQYRDLGEFHDFHRGVTNFDWPIFFIGGNHEPYGFLEQYPKGGELAPNCHYLGRVRKLSICGLDVVGLSGIFSETGLLGRPSLRELSSVSKKLFTYYTDEEVARAVSFGRADILVLHEWPQGAIQPDQSAAVAGKRRALRPELVGSDAARRIVDALRPRLIVAGHMHWRHRSQINASQFAALGHIDTGRDALGVFEAHTDGSILELT